jgi:tight adherence protein C
MIEQLIILAVSASIFLIVLTLFNLGSRPQFDERYQRFDQDLQKGPPGSIADDIQEIPFLERFAFPLLDRISNLSKSMTGQGIIDTASQRLREAGLYSKMPPLRFIGLSFFSGTSIAIVFYWIGSNYTGLNQSLVIVLSILTFFAGRALPIFILARVAKGRKIRIRKDLAYVLDLLTVSVEAGLGFDSAIAEICRRASGPIADEFTQTMREIQLGRNRSEALLDMPKRTGVKEIQQVVSAIVYTTKTGGSLARVLRVQASAMRMKRRQAAEEMAMKAPVKIMFPLVFFIFPAIFVVILGPAAITLKDMFGNF